MNLKFHKTAWRSVPIVIAAWAVSAAWLPVPVSAQIGRGATRPKVDRPDGTVWQVIRKNCTQWHGIDDYAIFALDKAGWRSLLDTKHKAPLAERTPVLSEQEWNTLLE